MKETEAKEKEIKDLESRISFWESKLKSSKNSVESAILTEKINFAKKDIESLKEKEIKKEIKPRLDDPTVIDKKENFNSSVQRGQVVDTTNEVYGLSL
jgi:predicted  nucleic acid-binding Zn-ribbon protein